MTLSPKEKTQIFQNRTLQFAKEIDSLQLQLPISFEQYCRQIINKSSKFFERLWAIVFPLDKETEKIFIQMVFYRISKIVITFITFIIRE
mgnify:CR=1 FL=1